LLWVPVWSIAGAVFASWGEGPLADALAGWKGNDHPWSSCGAWPVNCGSGAFGIMAYLHPWSNNAIGIMAFFPGILFVHHNSLAIATVNLLFGVSAIVVALGHHHRKSWARKLTLVFAGLGLLTSGLGLAFSYVVAAGIDAPGPGLWIPEILSSILFHLVGLAICIWSLWYLFRADVKGAFGATIQS